MGVYRRVSSHNIKILLTRKNNKNCLKELFNLELLSEGEKCCFEKPYI